MIRKKKKLSKQNKQSDCVKMKSTEHENRPEKFSTQKSALKEVNTEKISDREEEEESQKLQSDHVANWNNESSSDLNFLLEKAIIVSIILLSLCVCVCV